MRLYIMIMGGLWVDYYNSMEMQQEEAPLDNGCSPLPLKRNLIYHEQQAFDGAKMVYYLALPASMIVITLAHGYQIQETD